jgi:hypothetical protein
MGYKLGDSVIVTQNDNHQVGVVIDKYALKKQTVYDVLLESRTALIQLNTAISKNTYINKLLTSKLCLSEAVQCTVPYKDLLEQDLLPICKS